MRLLDIFENSTQFWYHGTPEMQKIEQFENRTIQVSYLTDPVAWKAAQDRLGQVPHGGEEYFKLLDQAGALNTWKKIRSPTFLSNNHSVARSYALDARAFDYENAVPGVLKVTVAPGKTLTVNARGQNFRGIEVDSVRRGLQAAGISDEQIEESLAHFAHQIRGDGKKITTDSLAAIVDDLGFEIVDVVGIKDNYMGDGPAATVRMVMDSSLIKIVRNEDAGQIDIQESLLWGGCWIKPDGTVLHLEPNPNEPIHHAEHVFDDPELDAIVDQRAMVDGDYTDDTRDIAVEVGLEAGWIRIRTHTNGNQFVVQFEQPMTKQAKRSFREYLSVYRGFDQFYLNDQTFSTAADLWSALS